MCSIEDLPHDILVEILSYLSVRDILWSAEHVSRQWKDACHTIDTWKHLVYQPGINLNNDAIIKEVQRMPKLQGLLLQHVFENDFLTAVMSECRYLRTLILTKCAVDSEMIQTVGLNCPNIEQLQIPIANTGGELCLEEVARLAKLKMLVLTAIVKRQPINLKPLADGCASLEGICFGAYWILKEDLIYFLEKKGSTLRQLQVVCDSVSGGCILPLLSVCNKLDWLHVVCRCSNPETVKKRIKMYSSGYYWEVDGFALAVGQPLNALNLKTVTSLSLYSSKLLHNIFPVEPGLHMMAIKLLLSDCLIQLVSLNLHLESDQKQFIDAICENCPLLKRLYLVYSDTLTDICLMNLPSLQLLEDVSLEGSGISKEDSIEYLSSCRSLQYLNLMRCKKLGGGAMTKLVTLSNLKRLILDECDVGCFPFHLISHHMKNLTYISLYNSTRVAWKDIEKLKENRPLVTIVHKLPFQCVCRCGYCPLMLLDKLSLEDRVPCYLSEAEQGN